jgi:hypothetical protein
VLAVMGNCVIPPERLQLASLFVHFVSPRMGIYPHAQQHLLRLRICSTSRSIVSRSLRRSSRGSDLDGALRFTSLSSSSPSMLLVERNLAVIS